MNVQWYRITLKRAAYNTCKYHRKIFENVISIFQSIVTKVVQIKLGKLDPIGKILHVISRASEHPAWFAI